MDGSSDSTHPACWCVSKGLAGMISQMSGLARAVGVDHECLTTRLRFPWTLVPTRLIPRSLSVTANSHLLTRTPPPRMVISCGRHGVTPALWLKKTYGDRVFAVQIQDPKVDPSPFDIVVAPKHDDVRGDNVYLTTGAIHYVTSERLDEARQSDLVRTITDGARPIVAVLVGGPNGYYSFSAADADGFVARLGKLADENDVQLVVLPSNRTPKSLWRRLQVEFGDDHYVWDGASENPYFATLAIAHHLVVTGDSVSMITEAASTGQPVFVQHLTEKRPAKRFRRFHKMFEDDGITRPFDGGLADWSFEPPNDTPQVAQIIRERIGIDGSASRAEEHDRAA